MEMNDEDKERISVRTVKYFDLQNDSLETLLSDALIIQILQNELSAYPETLVANDGDEIIIDASVDLIQEKLREAKGRERERKIKLLLE